MIFKKFWSAFRAQSNAWLRTAELSYGSFAFGS